MNGVAFFYDFEGLGLHFAMKCYFSKILACLSLELNLLVKGHQRS